MSSLIVASLKPCLPLECRMNVRNLKQLSGSVEQLVKHQLENVCRATLVDIEWSSENKKTTGDFVFFATISSTTNVSTTTNEKISTSTTTNEKISLSDLVKRWRDLYRDRYGKEFGLVQHVISCWKEVEVCLDNRIQYMQVKDGPTFQKKANWLELDKIFPKEVRKLDCKHVLMWLLSRLDLWSLFSISHPKNLSSSNNNDNNFSTRPKKMKFVPLTLAHVELFEQTCPIAALAKNQKKVKLSKTDQQRIIDFLLTCKTISLARSTRSSMRTPDVQLLSTSSSAILPTLSSAKTMKKAAAMTTSAAKILPSNTRRICATPAKLNHNNREDVAGGHWSQSMRDCFNRLRGRQHDEDDDDLDSPEPTDSISVSTQNQDFIVLEQDENYPFITSSREWMECYDRWRSRNMTFIKTQEAENAINNNESTAADNSDTCDTSDSDSESNSDDDDTVAALSHPVLPEIPHVVSMSDTKHVQPISGDLDSSLCVSYIDPSDPLLTNSDCNHYFAPMLGCPISPISF